MTRILGFIHIVVSVVLLLLGLLVAFLLWSGARDDDLLGLLIIGFSILGFTYVLPGLIGGIGLVRGQRWARGLIMVLSFVMLPMFPLGTLLGGFGLWILFTDGPDPLLKVGEQATGSRSNTPSSA